MKRLYVIGEQPIRIPGYGSKAPGEYFELESDVLAEAYAAEHEGLSLSESSKRLQYVQVNDAPIEEGVSHRKPAKKSVESEE